MKLPFSAVIFFLSPSPNPLRDRGKTIEEHTHNVFILSCNATSKLALASTTPVTKNSKKIVGAAAAKFNRQEIIIDCYKKHILKL